MLQSYSQISLASRVTPHPWNQSKSYLCFENSSRNSIRNVKRTKPISFIQSGIATSRLDLSIWKTGTSSKKRWTVQLLPQFHFFSFSQPINYFLFKLNLIISLSYFQIVIQFGLDMIEVIKQVRAIVNFEKLEMRIGIHTVTQTHYFGIIPSFLLWLIKLT